MSSEVKNCRGHLHPSSSVILYPALTSPALVPLCPQKDETGRPKGTARGGPLDVIIAGDALLKQTFDKDCSGAKAGKEFLRFCHSHLCLIEWRNLYGEGDNAHNVFPKGRSRFDALFTICGCMNMVYSIDQHNGPGVEAESGNYSGWYLGELAACSDAAGFPVLIFSADGKKRIPFGILGKSAVDMFMEGECPFLFHLRFSNIPNRVSGMHELLWLATEYSALDQQTPFHFIPEERITLPQFTEEIVHGGKPAKKHTKPQRLLSCATPPAEDRLPPGADTSSPYMSAEYARCRNSYGLFDLGGKTGGGDTAGESPAEQPDSPTPQPEDVQDQPLGKALDTLACMRQTGHLFTPRHPVYFSEKPLLDIGIIADPHISARQALYKLVGARVIPGVDGGIRKPGIEAALHHIEQPDPADSPLIGPMAHENLQSTRELFTGTAARSDVIFFAGDMYDHIRNCDPRIYRKRSGTDTEACRTGNFWGYMHSKEYKEDFDLYPRYIDAMLGLECIYQSYAKGTPVLFAAGNHEAYEHAYGISPRISGKDGSIKANAGIPLDHNLTFYEAALLYGPSYHQVDLGSWKDVPLSILQKLGLKYFSVGLFREENFAWLYQFLSPWKDVCVSYGDRQHILCLDWGRDEQYLPNAVPLLGGDTLPVANGALTRQQYELFRKRFGDKSGAVNILATHFTYAAYTHSVPLLHDAYAVRKDVPFAQSHEALGDGREYDIGTFSESRAEVWIAIQNGSVHYTLSGHTHRPGLYENLQHIFREAGEMSTYHRICQGMEAPGISTMETIKISKRKPPKSAAVLVSGSCGTYNKQNIFGELCNFGMDRPQSMVLRLDKDQEQVEIIRSSAPAPRLAVVMDYLWAEGYPLFMVQKRFCAPGAPKIKGVMMPIMEYQIICSGPGEKYTIHINPEVQRYFARDARPVPIVEAIKLHAVNQIPEGGGEAHGGCLVMRCEEGPVRNHIAQLQATGADVAYFIKTHVPKTAGITAPMFFCSVHFTQAWKETLDHLPTQYDFSSPWCFPASVNRFNGCYQIRRGWGAGRVAGDEVPDFERFQEIPEYKHKVE